MRGFVCRALARYVRRRCAAVIETVQSLENFQNPNEYYLGYPGPVPLLEPPLGLHEGSVLVPGIVVGEVRVGGRPLRRGCCCGGGCCGRCGGC